MACRDFGRTAPTPAKLKTLAELAVSGRPKVEIQATYPLDRADEAIKAFQAGTRGKVVLAI